MSHALVANETAQRRLELLRAMEWITTAANPLPFCPCCFDLQQNGHQEDCALAGEIGASDG